MLRELRLVDRCGCRILDRAGVWPLRCRARARSGGAGEGSDDRPKAATVRSGRELRMVRADDDRQHVLRRLCLGSEGSEGAPTASDSGRYVNRRSGDPVYASYRLMAIRKGRSQPM